MKDTKYLLKIFFIVITLVIIGGGVFLVYKKYTKPYNKDGNSSPTNSTGATPAINSTLNLNPQNESIAPIAEFSQRITKKPFGIFITPQNSPVQPERFSGYHTGVDIEYTDSEIDIPVYAIADGTVELVRTVSGYGGVIVLSFDYSGVKTYAVYGHLRLSSITKNNTVKKGEQIAVLGTGFSTETDGERRHLHFAILKKNMIDLKGYVPTLEDLNDGWYNPLDIIK